MKRKLSNELENDIQLNDSLAYTLNTHTFTDMVVDIDENVLGASYYRNVINKMYELEEGDSVTFRINTGGGDAEGLTSLIHAIQTTKAETIAEITGNAYSAGSLLALSCDAVVLGRYADMLCHSGSFGSQGKGIDVQRHVAHTVKHIEKLFKDCYKYFLSEQELKDVLEGKELYLDFDEISSRLEYKYEQLSALAAQEDEVDEILPRKKIH